MYHLTATLYNLNRLLMLQYNAYVDRIGATIIDVQLRWNGKRPSSAAQ